MNGGQSLMEAAVEARKNDTGSYTMADILSGGPTPAIGKKTIFPESKGTGHEHSKWDFLGNRAPETNIKSVTSTTTVALMEDHHFNSKQRAEGARIDQGFHTTKFHKGFARRNNEDIQADVPRLQREAELRERSLKHEEMRRTRLSELNNYNRFNVISGEYDLSGKKGMQSLPDTHTYDACFVSGTKATYMHPQMHTMFGPDDPGVGPYPQLLGPAPISSIRSYQGSRLPKPVAAQGRHSLAQSRFRYFAPAQSGDAHDIRQMNLVCEGGGPSHPKAAGGGNGQPRDIKSGVIGTFRYVDVLPSHGVEDQFSKSGYGKDPCEYESMERGSREVPAYFGLVETRRPGLYTPRKQAYRLEEMRAQTRQIHMSSALSNRSEGGMGNVSYRQKSSSRQELPRALSAPVSQRDAEIALVRALE